MSQTLSQVNWELELYTAGMEKFKRDQHRLRSTGRIEDTKAGSALLQRYVLDIASVLEDIADKKTQGVGGKYNKCLKRTALRLDEKGKPYYDWIAVAYIGLSVVIESVYGGRVNNRIMSNVARQLGGRLENDQHLHVFRRDNPAFVEVIEESLQAQGVVQYRHQLLTWQKKWRDQNSKWEPRSNIENIMVGLRIIKSIVFAMPEFFEIRKRHDKAGNYNMFVIEATSWLRDCIVEYDDWAAMGIVSTAPMLEKPLPWSAEKGELAAGGFHSLEVGGRIEFVKSKHEAHREYIAANPQTKHMAAVNAMQDTAWGVNEKVLAVIKEVVRDGLMPEALPSAEKIMLPPFPCDLAVKPRETFTEEDNERIGEWKQDMKRVHYKNKVNTSDIMKFTQARRMADKLKDRPFWFAYNCDFRGRIYTISATLSPQGPDYVRGLLQFHEGKPLGEDGLRWLAIHGANKYGEDKSTYADRVQWVRRNQKAIQAVVEEPTGTGLSFLRGADKPFQFLAFCFEWAGSNYGKDPTYVSHLPIGLDGSCNGIQHYSALLRDSRGGRSVNLIPAERPSDIYSDVRDEVRRLLLLRYDEDLARRWLTAGFDRKLTKRPVMTLPYGARQISCRRYVREWVVENREAFGLDPAKSGDKEEWELAVYMTPILWEAMGNVVIAAKIGMDWLQKVDWQLTENGTYTHWLSPAGFPVYQPYSKWDTQTVHIEIGRRLRVKIATSPAQVARHRSRNGIAPNFVHSLDSSHMVETVLKAQAEGITSFAMIHDDYGVHAADTERFFNIVRETFVDMYANKDWLEDWRQQMLALNPELEIPEHPPMGDLDLTVVTESPYFFG